MGGAVDLVGPVIPVREPGYGAGVGYWGGSGYVYVDFFGDLIFGECAKHLINDLTFFEDKKKGRAGCRR